MKKILPAALLLLAGPSTFAQNIGIGTTSPTDQLHTTGSVRFQNYAGIGTRLLYIDSAGRVAIPASTGTVFSSSAAVAIPDDGCTTNTGATSNILVSGLAAAVATAKIAVRINIAHSYIGDLNIYLVAPTGAILQLSAGNGVGTDNYPGTIFTNESPTNITAALYPYTGRYAPQGGLGANCSTIPTVSSFNTLSGGTINPNGTWALKVFDLALSDVGTISSWQITFDGQSGFGTTGVTGIIPYFNNGNLALSNISTNPATGNIGIGNNSPAYKLDVNGSLHVAGQTDIDGSIRLAAGNPAVGKILTATGVSGSADWQVPVQTNTGFLAATGSGLTIFHANSGIVPFIDNSVYAFDFDDGANFDNVTHGYKAPAAGVYQFHISIDLNNGTAASSGTISLTPLKNGIANLNFPYIQTTVNAGDLLPGSLQVSFIAKLAANDEVTVEITNNSGVNISTLTGAGTQFSGVRIY